MFFCSCSAFEGDQKTNVNEIIKTQKIRQLSGADVTLAAELFGESILKQIDEASVNCDSSRFVSFIDSLAITFKGRITLGESGSDFLLKEEKVLLEAYQYGISQNIKSKNAIQMLDGKTAL